MGTPHFYFKIYVPIIQTINRQSLTSFTVIKLLNINVELSTEKLIKFFSHEQPLSARGKIYFATLMDTETRPTGLKTNTIFQPFLMD